MKTLVIYDSFFGNTEKIAQAIGLALGSSANIQVLRVANVNLGQLAGLELLIVGSPTRSLRPSPAIATLIKSIPARGLNGVKVAAFDTRFTEKKLKSLAFILPIMSNLFGYAAKPIADGLAKKGGRLIVPPEGFFVEDTEGPLKEGELERAANWAKQILSTSAIQTTM